MENTLKNIATGKLALYLASKKHQKFEWSRHDCNTLVVEFHDYLHGTEYLKLLQDKYTDKRSAVKFIRGTLNNLKFFRMAGYQPTDDKPENLDILSDGYRAWIVFQGWAWTIAEGHRMVKQPINNLKATTWRNKLWVQQ